MIDGGEVAGEEIGFCPVELFFEAFVLLRERGVRDGAAVGADIDRDFEPIELINGMIREGFVHICLQVAGGADLEEDIRLFEMTREGGVFDASDPMADAGRMEIV